MANFFQPGVKYRRMRTILFPFFFDSEMADKNNVKDLGKGESLNAKGDKANRFRWNQGDKVLSLIKYLASYKSTMEYNNIDFNTDKVKQYEAVREAVAKIYAVDNPTFFGPPRITELSEEDSQNEQLAFRRPNAHST